MLVSNFEMSPHGAFASAYTPLMPSSKGVLAVHPSLLHLPAPQRLHQKITTPSLQDMESTPHACFAKVIKSLVNSSLVELAYVPIRTLSALVPQKHPAPQLLEQAMLAHGLTHT